MTLGGIVIAHDCLRFDYTLKETIQNLCDLCDKVLVVECESTDGTDAFVDELASKNSKIKIDYRPWRPVAHTGMKWLVDLVRHSKDLLGTDMYVQLDADEVFHEEQFKSIRALANERRPVCFQRHTFWRNPQSELPPGVICNHRCVRLAPLKDTICGDLIEPPHAIQTQLGVYHYGHLRKAENWIAKSRSLIFEAFNVVPDEWKRATPETISTVHDTVQNTVNFSGTHPAVMKEWLSNRGFQA